MVHGLQRVHGLSEGERPGGELLWFGCLPKAKAVAIYNLDNISDFLEQFPDMNNRLAGQVREVMDLPYLKPVLVAWPHSACTSWNNFTPSLPGREPLTAASPCSTWDYVAA